MKETKAQQGERLFKEGYELLEKEEENSLTSNRAFIKPMEKAAGLKNPKAEFVIGYLLCIGYKDLPVDIKRGTKILKKCFAGLEVLSQEEHDYQACKFLSEYYRVPLAGRVKDDDKVKALLTLSDSYREKAESPSGMESESDFVPTVVAPEEEKADTAPYDQLVRAISELKDDGSFDDKERLKIISVSADNGNMRAALFLGQAYESGKYVAKDMDTSKLYYLKAEKLGSVKAKFSLGRQAVEGNFARQDIVEGLNRIYLAAKSGLPEAQFYLGKVYYEGKYLTKDVTKAYIYFQAAFSRGYKEAESYLKAIEDQRGDKALVSKTAK
ncbi:MAG: sel1 repeat family protein [Bacilli bacterium]|jgi:TPR repeat protein|nr:sel1 repeat family protein [Bacilli bacterium]